MLQLRLGGKTHKVDGKRVPLEEGRIGLQAEYAELLYRNISIQKMEPDDPDFEKTEEQAEEN